MKPFPDDIPRATPIKPNRFMDKFRQFLRYQKLLNPPNSLDKLEIHKKMEVLELADKLILAREAFDRYG